MGGILQLVDGEGSYDADGFQQFDRAHGVSTWATNFSASAVSRQLACLPVDKTL